MLAAPIVLAGGKSTRFGRDKSLELLAGETLIQRVVQSLACFGDEITIVLSPGSSFAPFQSPVKLRKVYDIYPGRGSLGGVYTGLVHSPQQFNLIVASDMPFLNTKLLQYMVDMSPGYDLVIPRVNNNVEPVHAIYSKNCIPIIEQLWARGKSRVRDILEMAKTHYIEEQEINQFDPKHLSFFNVNTPDDLSRALALARELKATQG